MLQATEEKPARGQASGDQDGDRPRLRILALPRAATLLSHHGTSNKRYALVCPCWTMHPDSICSIHACLLSFRLSPGMSCRPPPAATRPKHLGPPCLNLPPSAAAPAAPASPHPSPPPPPPPLSLSPTHPLLRARRSPPPAQPVCFAFYPPASFLVSFGRCHRSCILHLHLPTQSINSRLYHRKPIPLAARCRTLAPSSAAACQFQCH
jgi:hypothetical protein